MSVRRLSKTFISGAGAAAEKSSSFLAGYSPAIDEMDLIERITVGAGGTSAIEFDQIPQTYQHLQVRIVGRSTNVKSDGIYITIIFNDYITTGYTYHGILGNGSTVSAWSESSSTTAYAQRLSSESHLSGIFGACIIDILDYKSSSKNKVIRSCGGFDANGSGSIYMNSSLWYATPSAINKITFGTETGNFSEYTTASLYGVKA